MLNSVSGCIREDYTNRVWLIRKLGLENNKVLGIASDPNLLKKNFTLKHDRDPGAMEFYNSKYFKHNLTRLGNKTCY